MYGYGQAMRETLLLAVMSLVHTVVYEVFNTADEKLKQACESACSVPETKCLRPS